jgi:hypothetical protein
MMASGKREGRAGQPEGKSKALRAAERGPAGLRGRQPRAPPLRPHRSFATTAPRRLACMGWARATTRHDTTRARPALRACRPPHPLIAFSQKRRNNAGGPLQKGKGGEVRSCATWLEKDPARSVVSVVIPPFVRKVKGLARPIGLSVRTSYPKVDAPLGPSTTCTPMQCTATFSQTLFLNLVTSNNVNQQKKRERPLKSQSNTDIG